VCECTKNKPC